MLTDYTAKGVGPDMTLSAFVRVLASGGSPVLLPEATKVYDYALQRGLSVAFLLAMFNHESSFGKAGSAATTHSWGNTRPPSFGVADIGVTDRNFSAYNNWVEGGISTVARLFDHLPYRGKNTVKEIIPIWAPSSDGNNTERYIQAVLADIERWATPVPPMSSPFFTFWRHLWA